MWFNPAELLNNRNAPPATSATLLLKEMESSKVARVADPLPVRIDNLGLQSSKVAEVAGPQDKETFIKCYDCLFFKSHHKHGKGSGKCDGGGKYGSWAESLHQCEVFDARIKYFDYVIDETGLIVDCFTPNGALIKIQARDQDHAQWLQRMNPKFRHPDLWGI